MFGTEINSGAFRRIKLRKRKIMKKLILITFTLVWGLFVIEAGAQPTIKIDQSQLKAIATQQYLAEYADKLEAKLKNKSVGYSFAVISNNNFIVTRAGGDARRAPDGDRCHHHQFAVRTQSFHCQRRQRCDE